MIPTTCSGLPTNSYLLKVRPNAHALNQSVCCAFSVPFNSGALGTHLVPCNSIGGFPKIRITFLGVPIIRTIVFWGLYWGNYHLRQGENSNILLSTMETVGTLQSLQTRPSLKGVEPTLLE